MNNQPLKNKIEKAANVKLQVRSCKSIGDDRFEAYVSAFDLVDGERAQKAKAHASIYFADERGYAIRYALIRIADKLGTTITEEERTAVERATDANWKSRMGLAQD